MEMYFLMRHNLPSFIKGFCRKLQHEKTASHKEDI